MINHVVHKEKVKKEIIDLIKKMRNPNYIITDNQIEQQIELILHHMYRFVFNKLMKNGLFDNDSVQHQKEKEK